MVNQSFPAYKYNALQNEENGIIDTEQCYSSRNNGVPYVPKHDDIEEEGGYSLFETICNFFSCGGCFTDNDFDDESIRKFFENSVTNEQYENLKQAFITFDMNADGFIDSEDLGHVMRKLGHDLSSKEVKKLFKDICKHRNGKLDFTDFVEMMAQDKLVLTTSEQELLAAFTFLDQNSDGYITVDELMDRFEGCLSDAEASRLMSEADANGDGKIDFAEFKHMMFNQERGISLVQSEIQLYS